MALPLHLLGLILVALWVLYSRKPNGRLGLRTLWLLWLSGLFLMRLAPQLLGRYVLHGGSPAGAHLVSWVGSLLLLRAIIGLSRSDRPMTRFERIKIGAFTAGLLLAGSSAGALSVLAVVLAVPFVWSFRWRARLSAAGLAMAWLTALVSLVICILGIGGIDFTLLGKAVRIYGTLQMLALFYSIAVMPAAAGRLHLSIRRIGPRLVGSHLLAGVVPLGLTAVFLLLSGAVFLSTYRGSIAVRALKGISETAAARLRARPDAPGRPFGDEFATQAVIVREGEGPARVLSGTVPFSADTLLTSDLPSSKTPLLWDGRTLYVRARADTVIGGRPLRLEALAPVDSSALARISGMVGVPVRAIPLMRVVRNAGGVQIGIEPGRTPGEEGEEDAAASHGSAIGPPAAPGFHLPGGAIVSCIRPDSAGWTASSFPIVSSASFGEQISSLFTVSKENPLATVALAILGVLAVFLVGVVWVTSTMVVGMGRSITRAVRALTEATGALRKGEFGHRIRLEADDELWSVASSFNEMAEGLEKMRAMELETERLEEELRLARKIQDRLLPAGAPVMEGAELSGISLPAREVGGDYFDYLILEGGQIGVAIADVSGKGAPAALLMSSFRASLRSQDLAALGPAEVLTRINRFIHSSVDPGKFITAFLGLFDPSTGTLRYASAGHDAPFVLQANGKLDELPGGGLILGILPQFGYEEATTRLNPGSILAVFTDGVTEAQNPAGEFFGPERIADNLRSTQGQTSARVLQSLVDAVREFSGTGPQTDDITLVVARRF